MELDHVFCFVSSQLAAEQAVEHLGLKETYRRQHAGQGTANICCCFDNAFIEFLWLTNATEACNARVARLGLFERSRAAEGGICPFGISWRGDAATPTPPIWSYEPEYLPKGTSITVLEGSDDHRLPLVFQSPGTLRPLDWPQERQGSLQHAAGYAEIFKVVFAGPKTVIEHPMLRWLAKHGVIDLTWHHAGGTKLHVDISDRSGRRARHITFPDMIVNVV